MNKREAVLIANKKDKKLYCKKQTSPQALHHGNQLISFTHIGGFDRVKKMCVKEQA